MASDAVVVLGDDAVSVGLAGRLTLDGHQVTLWSPPGSRASSGPLCERSQVRLTGAGGEATATLDAVTGDSIAALAAGDVLLTCAQQRVQPVFEELVLPLIEPRHTLVLLPGSLGSLACAKWLRDRGRGARGPATMVESDTAPLIAHWSAPDAVHVTAVVEGPGFGVFPACRTAESRAALERLFPAARMHVHVLAAALGEIAPVLRAPALLLNAAAVERSRAGSSLLGGGFTPAVARLAEVLDGERLALAGALGVELPTAPEALHIWGLGPHGDLWSTVNGSRALTLTPEEVPIGWPHIDDAIVSLRFWVQLAETLSVATPACRALVILHEAATGVDDSESRSLADLGINSLTTEDLARFLETGSSGPEG